MTAASTSSIGSIAGSLYSKAGLIVASLTSENAYKVLYSLVVLYFTVVVGWLSTLLLVLRFVVAPFRFFKSKNRDHLRKNMFIDETHGKHEYITANGIRIHYVTKGKGPLLLFLHGFPECWYSFRYQLDHFSKNYKCVALDLRGFGNTDKPIHPDSYNVDTILQDIQEVVYGLGYEKCILVGHDIGSIIGWLFTSRYSELVTEFVCLNGVHPRKFRQYLISHPRQLFKSLYMLIFQIPVLSELYLYAFDWQAIKDVYRKGSKLSPIEVEYNIAAVSQPGVVSSALNYYRQMIYGNFADDALEKTKGVKPKITTPCLVIGGQKDPFFDSQINDNLVDIVQTLELKSVPDAGHFVHQDAPKLTNDYIEAFINKSK